MKHQVMAKTTGQYNGRIYERGDVFIFEDKKLVVKQDKDGVIVRNTNGQPVMEQVDVKIGKWMEVIAKGAPEVKK